MSEDWSPEDELAALQLMDIMEQATAIITEMMERLVDVRAQGQKFLDRRLAAHPDAQEWAAHAREFYDFP